MPLEDLTKKREGRFIIDFNLRVRDHINQRTMEHVSSGYFDSLIKIYEKIIPKERLRILVLELTGEMMGCPQCERIAGYLRGNYFREKDRFGQPYNEPNFSPQ